MNVKSEFRYSSRTRFTLNTIYNDANEPYNRFYETRAFTNQTAPNATTSGVVPGYTDRITTVRPVATSVIDVTSQLSTGQVAGFIPQTGNVSLSWRYRGFGVRLLANYTGDYITTYTAATVGRNLYKYKRTITNLGLSYQLRPGVGLSLDIANLTNEPQAQYRGIPDQMERTVIAGTTITVGIGGRF